MFGFGSKSATGIYLAGDSAWIASLNRSRKGLVPLALVECSLPRTLEPSMLVDAGARSQLASALADVAQEYEVDLANVCFALDRRLVLLKRSELIPGGDKEIREHVEWEAEQFLQGGDEEFSIDSLLVPEWGFSIAARHSALDSYLDLGEEAGMGHIDVDVAAFALYNAGEMAGLLPASDRELLVYSAEGEAHMLLMEEGEPLQLTSCAWDGDEEAGRVMGTEATRLLQEVDGDVERVWCAGPDVENWESALSAQLGISTELLDPLAEIDDEWLSDEMTLGQRSAYAIAIGLAQRGLDS